jgi:EmrB/QacA subfamily drug resistance transporter
MATHARRLLAVLLVAPFLAQADATIANVATPSIHADLGASGAELELVIGAYLIAFAVLLITGARLGQTYGYRRMFMTGLAVFGCASLACGLAPVPAVLVIARVLQGAGAALMFPQTLTGIQLNFGDAGRARAIGLYAIALSTGAVVGQILGGVLVSADIAGTHWRAIFLVNVPVCALAIAAAYAYLPADQPSAARRLDLAGVALICASALLAVLPLVIGRGEGWPVWVWACLAASVPAFALFVRAERAVEARGGAPLVNVSVLARGPVAWSLATLFAATGTYYALLFTLAQYLQRGLGHSALVSGLTLLPWVAAFGIAGRLVGRLNPRLARTAPTVGCLILAGAYAAIAVGLLAGSSSEALLIPLLAAGGFGLGIQFSGLIARVTASVPSTYAADVSGVTTTTTQIGGALGVAVFGTLYESLSHIGEGSAMHAFALVSAGFAAVAAGAAATAWRATPSVARAEPATT